MNQSLSSFTVHRLPAFKVLGVWVDAVQIPDVIAQMEHWIQERKYSHFIAVTGMHGVTEAQQDPAFKEILNAADLVVADGMPLVWLGRQQGFILKRRVYGPELMETFCRDSGEKYRHFFYGGAQGVPDRLGHVLEQRYGLNVVGTYSPPFRQLTPEEDVKVVNIINQTEPDILWVGLSTPKQEHWMYGHRNRLHVPVMVGVGAAFDINTGRIREAPYWMRECGLQWLFRLITEPRRLWRRYLIYGSKFTIMVMIESLHLRQFD